MRAAEARRAWWPRVRFGEASDAMNERRKGAVNWPLLVILLLVLVALLGYALLREKPDERAAIIIEPPKVDPFLVEPDDGVLAEDTPELDVQVTPKMDGQQKKIEFAITERHGWWVTAVYVQAWYGEPNAETGEWERTIDHPIQLLCMKPVSFGETLVAQTTLTNVDLNWLDGRFGGPENWRGEVYKYGKVFKPKSK